MKPYYEQDGVTIYHGDCLQVAPSLGFTGLVLTDPPYGIAHPTDYAKRGRGDIARCTDYVPVRGDDKPFDPRWLLTLGSARILWGPACLHAVCRPGGAGGATARRWRGTARTRSTYASGLRSAVARTRGH